MTHRLILAALLIAGIVQAASAAEEEAPTGYTDTPLLPGSKWHVHDGVHRERLERLETRVSWSRGDGDVLPIGRDSCLSSQ